MPAFRRLAPLVFSLALLCVGCKTAKNTTTPLPSESPTSTTSAQTATDFQLVGTAVHAFVGVGPSIDTNGSASTTETSPSPTQATSATFGNPTDRGVMRVRLDDTSDSLKSSCGAARDETAIVYWTTATQFDTSLLASDLESSLEGRTVGVVGRLFTSSQANDQIGAASPSPSASPAAAINPECVLVADQVGTSSGTALPTARPRVATTRTATPTLAPTSAPTVKPTAAPTVSPVVTVSPTPVPTPT